MEISPAEIKELFPKLHEQFPDAPISKVLDALEKSDMSEDAACVLLGGGGVADDANAAQAPKSSLAAQLEAQFVGTPVALPAVKNRVAVAKENVQVKKKRKDNKGTAAAAVQAPLAEGWSELKDAKQRSYFFHAQRDVVTWIAPREGVVIPDADVEAVVRRENARGTRKPPAPSLAAKKTSNKAKKDKSLPRWRTLHGRFPEGVAFVAPTEAAGPIHDDEAVLFATDPRLTEVYAGMDADEKMQFRLTEFEFYAEKERCLCPLDFGLIEKDVPVFVRAVVKPIFDEADDDVDGWPLCTVIGPVISWHTEGFDGGSKPVVGIATPYAEYKLLGSPTDDYAPFFRRVLEKASLTKGIIEFLSENPESTYERLLAHLLLVPPPTQDSGRFAEDDVLKHLKFLLDQVWDYDQYKDSSDEALCDSPAVTYLLELEGSGVSRARAARRKAKRGASAAKGGEFKSRHGGMHATVTPLVETVFSEYFKKELAKTKRVSVDPTWTNYLAVFDGEIVYVVGKEQVKSYAVLCVDSAKSPAALSVRVAADCLTADGLEEAHAADLLNVAPPTLKTMTLGAFEKHAGSAAKKARESVRFVATDASLHKTAIAEGWTEVDVDEEEEEAVAAAPAAAAESAAERKKKELPSRAYFNDNLDAVLEANGCGDLGVFEQAVAVGEPTCVSTEGVAYYSAASLTKGDTTVVVSVGECILITPQTTAQGILDDDDSWVLRINYIYAAKSGKLRANGLRLVHGRATVLGRVASVHELFVVDQLITVNLASDVLCSLKGVVRTPIPADWATAGNASEEDLIAVRTEHYSTERQTEGIDAFVWKLQYDVEFARFSYPSDVNARCVERDMVSASAALMAVSKRDAGEISDADVASAIKRVAAQRDADAGVIVESDVAIVRGVEYRVGDGVMCKFEALELKLEEDLSFVLPEEALEHKAVLASDSVRFPEAWRKKDSRPKGSHDDTQPYRVLRVEGMRRDALKVRAFYRPENTTLGERDGFCFHEHEVFYSDETTWLPMDDVLTKCVVFQLPVEADDLMGDDEAVEEDHESLIKRFETSEEAFFFRKKYTSTKQIETLTEDVGMGVACPGPSIAKSVRPLRLLDIFAGCGGLSTGLQQSGVAVGKWAIEFEPPAASAFAANHPSAETFCEDCNLLLKKAMDGVEAMESGQPIPKRGEVEALAGGPPCQGFSGMNRFSAGQYSRFKNSLVATYLSYCDFYRPKLFLLENVKNFAIYHEGIVVQMCLRALVEMGYQATFGCLQAGSYGVPQSRRRLIIMASVPGQALPRYPEPEHAFTSRATQINVKVNGYTICGVTRRGGPAHLRRITVRDAIGDLPEVEIGESRDVMPHTKPASTDFQRRMRGAATVISHHIVKKMSPLVKLRFERVPTYAGADWRDLPNETVEYDATDASAKTHSNNPRASSKTVLLEYPGGIPSEVDVEVRTSRKWDGGVGDKNQENTIIPWCLPHTGNRHNNWAGLYGRLDYFGHFGTTVTNPEPMGKQGVVVHPDQHRVVSVRECARSQGFPDSYEFVGHVVDRHRQVGNAVPPPLARAVGQEWLKVWEAVADDEVVDMVE